MDQLVENLRAIVGREHVRSDPDELLVYECDGLTQHKHLPRAVVFPASTEEVAEVVKTLARAGVSFAPRGAGTGLSGGALAIDQGVVVELARMRRLLKVDVENRLAVVETGMVNAKLSRAVAAHNLYYVPDPSSGAACTIGGNIAENAGGIHCLKYGTTTDHVLAARVVLSDGQVIDLGGMSGAGQASVGGLHVEGLPNYDLLGVFIGSEGTFGIATEATVKLLPLPSAVRTMLADFTDVDAASRAVSAIIAEGLLPAALEMVDGATIRAVEASVFAAGLPLDAQAALLIELDGLEVGLDAEAARAEALCREHGARNVRHAAGEHERKKLWAARKGAFGAMGRLAPDMMIQDAVVPRSSLPGVLAATYRIAAKYRLRLANVFHAGDGNLHPFISFDRRDRDELSRVEAAGREIMETCVRAGGTITGEHGVGLDKSAYLPLIFSPDDLSAMLSVRAAFDPSRLCNPGKIIPTPRGCGEARAVAATQSTSDVAMLPTPSASQPTQTNRLDKEQRRLTPTTELNVDSTEKLSRLSLLALDGDAARRALAECVGESSVSLDGETLVVAPANEFEACEIMRLAAANAWPVVPTGAHLWFDAGNGTRTLHLDITTRRMTRMLRHEPADLVATAEAGLSLAAFNQQLAQSRQWLPLDPPDDERATLGGIVATGLGGAHASAYGAPRAFVLGMRMLLADGRIIKAGGRVVKNVAGYDLCKLFTGSHGTLGLITELTFKLRPRPACEATLVVRATDTLALYRRTRELLAAEFLPVAAELLSPRFAAKLGLTEDSEQDTAQFVSLIRFAGAEATVASQLERGRVWFVQDNADASLEVMSDDAALWRTLAATPLNTEHALRWRAHVKPSDLPLLLTAFAQRTGDHSRTSLWHAGLGDGRVRVMKSAEAVSQDEATELNELRRTVEDKGGSLSIEAAPDELKKEVMSWKRAETNALLMRRVKQQLDPQDLLCRGVFS